MKVIFLTFLTIFSFGITCGQSAFEGAFVGLEEMCWTDSLGHKDCYTDPSKKEWKWYHQTILKIKGDSVFVDQNPISIFGKDTLYSASDGGFYYYSGTITSKTDTTINVDLIELFCDYCAQLVKKTSNGTYEKMQRKKHYLLNLTSKGLLINNFIFKKTDKNLQLTSEHPER